MALLIFPPGLAKYFSLEYHTASTNCAGTMLQVMTNDKVL